MNLSVSLLQMKRRKNLFSFKKRVYSRLTEYYASKFRKKENLIGMKLDYGILFQFKKFISNFFSLIGSPAKTN